MSDLPQELRDLALELAELAAARHRAGDLGAVESKSSHTDPVTQVDKDSEQIIIDVLTERRPNDAILGEEGTDVEGTSGVRWIIDPLDGTVNYLYGFASYAVSIAAELDGEMIAGVVHDTANDIVFAAALGHGATRNGQPIGANNLTDPSIALLATGFAYDAEIRVRQGATLALIVPQVRDIRRAGCASLDMCLVACGSVDAYYETGPNLWDVAAGQVIVSEAGGSSVYDPSTSRIVAACDGLMAPLEQLIAAAELSSTQTSPG